MISTTQANNSPEALRRYREGWQRAFERTCYLCHDRAEYREWVNASGKRCVCIACHGTGTEPEARA